MAYGDYVAFLRSALVAIGLSETEAALFAGQSARAGAASEAAAGGLHQEDIQNRMALMVQPALPGGAATRVARPRPLRRQVGVWDECVFGGACPGLESRGGVRASNMQCKPKYPKPACLLCLRIASLPEQSAGRLLVLLSVPKSRTMPASS